MKIIDTIDNNTIDDTPEKMLRRLKRGQFYYMKQCLTESAEANSERHYNEHDNYYMRWAVLVDGWIDKKTGIGFYRNTNKDNWWCAVDLDTGFDMLPRQQKTKKEGVEALIKSLPHLLKIYTDNELYYDFQKFCLNYLIEHEHFSKETSINLDTIKEIFQEEHYEVRYEVRFIDVR